MLTDVAKSLTTLLLSVGLPAERRYVPRRKLEDFATLRVTVVARGVAIERAARGSRQYTYTVDVAYQQRLAASEALAEEAELDAHTARVDVILDLLDPQETPSVAGARIVAAEPYSSDEAPYSMKHLAEMRLFTAVVKVTLEEDREAAP